MWGKVMQQTLCGELSRRSQIPTLPPTSKLQDPNVCQGKGLGVTTIGLNPWSDQLRYTDVMFNLWSNDVDNNLDVRPSRLERKSNQLRSDNRRTILLEFV